MVSSNILLSTLEQELKDKDDAVSKLREAISSAKLDYNYIIIDCPPSLGFLTFNALRAAEMVLVPIDMSAFSLMGVGKLLGMLELIKVKIGHSPAINAVATLFDNRTKYSHTMLTEIKSFFRDQMLRTVIRTSVALKKAAANGISVIQFDKSSNGAIDHIALANELLEAEGAKEFEKALRELPMALPSPAIQEPVNKEVDFTVNAPDAREIYLVGDFNHWKINEESRLARLDDGKWVKKMGLEPGKYRYKFVVDGEWTIDNHNTDREQNAFGTFDSIIKL